MTTEELARARALRRGVEENLRRRLRRVRGDKKAMEFAELVCRYQRFCAAELAKYRERVAELKAALHPFAAEGVKPGATEDQKKAAAVWPVYAKRRSEPDLLVEGDEESIV